ncbi:MAG: McrC family protein [Thermoguttaceae bacterium]
MVTTIKTTDNNCGKCDISDADHKNLQQIAGRSITSLQDENSGLLVFPHCLRESQDKIGDGKIFDLGGNKLTTNNVMGFIGVNGTQVRIRSRFAQDEDHDYFLHYMLQKVFRFNLFDWRHTQEREDVFDFLLYLFPYFLNRALRHGVFKSYQKREYNDANVRGVIDVGRHLRHNIPFGGKVAYSTREHSCDNYITQLIRHTLEFIRAHRFCCGVLTSDAITRENAAKIDTATPTYHRHQRETVVKQNLKPLNHPYFHVYRNLQTICLRILRHEKLKYGSDTNEPIYGILFDGAWLWEEYLATILVPAFVHPKNKTGTSPVPIFRESAKPSCFPDFYNSRLVADAKYKRLDESVDSGDLRQIISYMHVLKVEHGCFIFPSEKDVTKKDRVGELCGYGGIVEKLAVRIPKQVQNWNDFRTQIDVMERHLVAEFAAP